MNEHKLTPLAPGEIALRPRVSWSTHRDSRGALPIITGLQAVEVLSTDGEFVTWTNHLPARRNGAPVEKFKHISHRAELIALSWLETLSAAPAENPAVPNTALPLSGQESGAAES
jgi:hypothetical protein